MKRGTLLLGLALLVATPSCRRERPAASVMFGQPAVQPKADDYDLPDIQAAGELIAVTLSGPDTYYEYRGQGFGIQFLMAESFARNIGARLRMEIASDTMALVKKLLVGEADLIALDLPTDGLSLALNDNLSGLRADLLPCRAGWAVRGTSPLLAEAADRWFQPDTRSRLLTEAEQRQHPRHQPRRRPRAVMQNRERGIISPYDALFVRHAATIGWDWRLLAAQCYQESAFDPRAVSWAGARGLMQLMPGTAARFGLPADRLFDADGNIAAAARYLAYLNALFADVPHSSERIHFVLAAYNGGEGHVRDAMALAEKEGHTATCWADVQHYLLALSQPRYYRDPVVRCGYLRGSETVDYVQQIHALWASYRLAARPVAVPQTLPSSASKPSKIKSRSAFELRDSVDA